MDWRSTQPILRPRVARLAILAYEYGRDLAPGLDLA